VQDPSAAIGIGGYRRSPPMCLRLAMAVRRERGSRGAVLKKAGFLT
jgi:hypothetical protein